MSSSRSSTAQQTWQQDNRRVIGERGVSAEGGSTVTINALDGDVVNRAFAYGNDVGGKAFDLAGESVNAVLGFGGKAMAAALDAQADALAFADSNATRNTTAAYNFSSDALGEAFSFGGNALNKAFGAAENATALVKDAYADAKGRGALTDKILIAAVGAMALVAFAAVKK
ncbi:hypothetical protein DBR12_06190 [Acidovorax sp. HMWF029]|uniref:hypothetical protein n=1 Tax=Acidovorax sp. HMWF029 TaxID=2056863 RepID=UPI000D368342|nr:hypothetical protein [Acidovorax sp. HMWF029]PTT21656.1 hypothetical protein DBR12_06190 [Acidovorax sp. HMWF029]